MTQIDDDAAHRNEWKLLIPSPEQIAFANRLEEIMEQLAQQREIDLTTISPEMFEFFYDECYRLVKKELS